MNSPDKLSVNKPTSIWQRPVDLKFGKLLPSLGKGAIAAFTQNWPEAAKGGVDVIAALGLKREPSEIAWLLLERSLLGAMFELTRSKRGLFNRQVLETDWNELCRQLDEVLASGEIGLDSNFFEKPEQSPILDVMKRPYQKWLHGFGITEAEAQAICYELPLYFVEALDRELSSVGETYAVVRNQLATSLGKPLERVRAWVNYAESLQQDVNEPLFSFEVFSLKEIYIPLRAYYEQEIKEKFNKPTERIDFARGQLKRVVVDLQTELEAWLKKADKDDALRVICGGPGCGKSSFAKIFAATLAEQYRQVLLIPLHRFKLEKDLVDGLGHFIGDDPDHNRLPNPLKSDNVKPRLLLIFDGLDELAMQRKVATEAAQQFVSEVQAKLMLFNRYEARLQVMITGRELVIQSNANQFRNSQQVLHVLPYFQSKKEIQKHSYLDEQGLLEQDQRQVWWQKYGALTGSNYAGLPSGLERDQLREITAQPLLNYLVALSFTAGDLDFSQETNLNNIYADLLERIYRRNWERYQHPMLGDISRDQFIRILEEIAVACWHGNGRTTTVGEIEEHCAASGLQTMLEIFQEGAKTGVTRLLTAFYFRQSGVKGSEKTFEFTHKSFGEYLTARRIVWEVESIEDELTRHQKSPGRGWNEQECLKRWAMLCGATTMDQYLLNFIWDEIELRDHEQVAQWQGIFCRLISTMLRQGMPMERLDPRPSYFEECRQARNAEEALLAVLSACAMVTKQVSKIDWETPETLGTWLVRLQGYRSSYGENSLAYYCLCYLDASQQNLSNIDLKGANLGRVNLRQAHLLEVDLEGANLGGANLVKAYLGGANLRSANLEGANLEEANLVEAYLGGANLIQANLVQAFLDRANLEGANLEGAKLRRSDLQWVTLNGGSLEDVIFVDEESP